MNHSWSHHTYVLTTIFKTRPDVNHFTQEIEITQFSKKISMQDKTQIGTAGQYQIQAETEAKNFLLSLSDSPR